jgi:dTDP-4-amino-4,6-dideoxygalactose transaminase
MDRIMEIASRNNLYVVEDAAQAIDAYYNGKPLGGIGHFGCFSFHDTKNIVCGEGGLLAINDEKFFPRAEIVWEKGTNRSAFIRGEVDKYGWVGIGSSFLVSEVTAAFLYAQLEAIDTIQKIRKQVWDYYRDNLNTVVSQYGIELPNIPGFAVHNAHIFYLVCTSVEQRDGLTRILKKAGIQAFFHYPPLHLSEFHLKSHRPENLPNAARYSELLIRLPVYAGLAAKDQDFIIDQLQSALAQLETALP